MNNFAKNVMGGLLVAFYLMCFVFPFQLASNMFNEHLPIEQFLVNQIITFFAVWVIGYFCTELYRDLLANANRPRSEDEQIKGPQEEKNLNDVKDGDQDSNKDAGQKPK